MKLKAQCIWDRNMLYPYRIYLYPIYKNILTDIYFLILTVNILPILFSKYFLLGGLFLLGLIPVGFAYYGWLERNFQASESSAKQNGISHSPSSITFFDEYFTILKVGKITNKEISFSYTDIFQIFRLPEIDLIILKSGLMIPVLSASIQSSNDKNWFSPIIKQYPNIKYRNYSTKRTRGKNYVL